MMDAAHVRRARNVLRLQVVCARPANYLAHTSQPPSNASRYRSSFTQSWRQLKRAIALAGWPLPFCWGGGFRVFERGCLVGASPRWMSCRAPHAARVWRKSLAHQPPNTLHGSRPVGRPGRAPTMSSIGSNAPYRYPTGTGGRPCSRPRPPTPTHSPPSPPSAY